MNSASEAISAANATAPTSATINSAFADCIMRVPLDLHEFLSSPDHGLSYEEFRTYLYLGMIAHTDGWFIDVVTLGHCLGRANVTSVASQAQVKAVLSGLVEKKLLLRPTAQHHWIVLDPKGELQVGTPVHIELYEG